jgi:superfamily II DNA or RNA helicase
MSDLRRRLERADGIYHIPDDDLLGEVLIPGLGAATEVRIGAGFFSSGSLGQLAPGLAEQLNENRPPIKMILSPSLSVEDSEAIFSGVADRDGVIARCTQRIFDGARYSASKIVQHTLDCLSILVAQDRLELKVVLYPNGSYHRKIWLLSADGDRVVVHGSGNATYRGLVSNGEQMTVDCSWWDEARSVARIRRLSDVWEREWCGDSPYCVTRAVPEVIAEIRDHARSLEHAPTTEDLWRAWQADFKVGQSDLAPHSTPAGVVKPTSRLLAIPEWLDWKAGRYAHQAKAVDAFEQNGSRGILAIATGGGKTKTAMIAATRAQDEHSGPALIVILVPTSPLEAQWAEEVSVFGLNPVRPSSSSPARRRVRLEELQAALSVTQPHTEVVLLQTGLLRTDDYLKEFFVNVGRHCLKFLIADEVHNMGASATLRALPPSFTHRIGLSATPVRQYDPEGTALLEEYFGPEVFRFSLGDAIDSGCLVRYEYYLHETRLNGSEFSKYQDLTRRLAKFGRASDDGRPDGGANDQVERLLRERRAVLEHAAGKLDLLRRLLEDVGPSAVQRTLIYASQKPDPFERGRQIDDVNGLLRSMGIDFHQFTYTETSQPDARVHLERFASGELQVLTAMKVLDEGVDLPATETAFVLASSTVEREWVQRRGRILRTAPGKTVARLHDFFVVPPEPTHPASVPLIKSELRRANAFAELAANEYSVGGPRELIQKYEQLVYSTGNYEDD